MDELDLAFGHEGTVDSVVSVPGPAQIDEEWDGVSDLIREAG